MKILIVGGAGFIGRNLIKELSKDKSNEIFVIDDLSTGILDEINSLFLEYEYCQS